MLGSFKILRNNWLTRFSLPYSVPLCYYFFPLDLLASVFSSFCGRVGLEPSLNSRIKIGAKILFRKILRFNVEKYWTNLWYLTFLQDFKGATPLYFSGKKTTASRLSVQMARGQNIGAWWPVLKVPTLVTKFLYFDRALFQGYGFARMHGKTLNRRALSATILERQK